MAGQSKDGAGASPRSRRGTATFRPAEADPPSQPAGEPATPPKPRAIVRTVTRTRQAAAPVEAPPAPPPAPVRRGVAITKAVTTTRKAAAAPIETPAADAAPPPKRPVGIARTVATTRSVVPADPPPAPSHAAAPMPVEAVRPDPEPGSAADGLQEQARRLFDAAVRLHRAGKLHEAIGAYRRAVDTDPLHPAAWINLGVALRAVGHPDAAVAALSRGVALNPDDAAAHSNLGNALRACGRLDEAKGAQLRSIRRDPNGAAAHYNLALLLRDLGDLDEAVTLFDRARALGYRQAELLWDRALALLLAGRLKEGFAEYENRWRLAESPPRFPEVPAWEGEDLEGRTLLVHAEQGLGDTLQFVRYLPLLRRSGGRIVLECQTALARLFRESASLSGIEIVARDGRSLPHFDLQIPLLSLPRVMGTDIDSLPAVVPYLSPPADLPSLGHPMAGPGGRLPRIGIAWAGKPTHRNDRNRSVPLSAFLPILEIPGLRFYGLQKGPSAMQIEVAGLQALVFDLSPRLQDFADTAGIVKQLDLVISVDTSVVHLAGALGRPVWTLLPFAPDWRWQLRRGDCPWYPTMRLFRQTSPGDWEELFHRVRHALGDFIVRRARGQK